LFNNYTHIYNRLLRDQIDLQTLHKFLDVLSTIERGKVSQHEASYTIGALLKQMYVDPKIVESEKQFIVGKKTSWTQYKSSL
jgi:hypothetical protein